MALNVWLIFERGYDEGRLRGLEKWYLGFAYGVPAVAAVGYLVHDRVGTGRILGPAEVSCSVGIVRRD